MEVVTLTDLAPILAAVVGPMLAIMFAMMRYQHIDSTKTRDLIDESNKENRELIERSNQENRELIKENREFIKENRDLIEKNHWDLTSSLGEVRKRLAAIEGYLRQSPPPPPDSDAQAA